jgi:hypothetical protein
MKKTCGGLHRSTVRVGFVLIVAACAIALGSCRSRWPDVEVTVINTTGIEIQSFSSKAPSEEEWGEELLSADLEDAAATTFFLVKGVYDFRALLSDTSAAYVDDADLTSLEFFTITLTPEDSQ